MLHKKPQKSSVLFRYLALLGCLGAFLVGQFQQQIQHQLTHSHEQEEHHGPAQEADACHVSIFHAGADNACSHPVHVSTKLPTCERCDSFLHSFWSAEKVSFPQLQVNIAEAVFLYTAPTDQLAGPPMRSRAPPRQGEV